MSLIMEEILNSPLRKIAEKVLSNKRISFDDALTLYESGDLLYVGALAEYARKKRAACGEENYVYFINNHHLNITNVCEGDCSFCAYRKHKDHNQAYFLELPEIEKYLIENVSKEIKELHIVSALNPKANLKYYIELFNLCKKIIPGVHIQALTAVEIDYLSKIENMPPENILTELSEVGLGSIPGGGAEIFHESIRNMVCPDKISGDRWLDIMKIAHNLGIKSNATMLTGIGESYIHRVDHLERIRSTQDETKGFMTFIPLVCHYENTELEVANNNTGIDNLKDLAISRLYLDNVPHIKAFWIQLGIKLAQVSLAFGVDDLDGTVVKEKISSAAGANSAHCVTKKSLINLIQNASRIPVERDTVYNIIKIYR